MSKELHEHEHHGHEHSENCGCESIHEQHHHHEHQHEHSHHHEHGDACGCGHEHEHEHQHHEHEHEHSHHHEHSDACGCGHEHEHEHHHHEHEYEHSHHHEHGDACACGCGHEHEHDVHDNENHEHDFDNISENSQRIYIVDGLDCANCAAKMERKIQAMPEIQAASITFATKQLKIAAANPDILLPKLESACRSIEDNVKLVEKDKAKSPASKSKKGFFRQNATDIISISAGAVLFAAGVILEHWGMLSLSFMLPVFIIAYIILGWEVLWTSIKNISRGQVFDENFLMSVATIAAFCIGDFAEGVGVMLFYRIGEFFEHVAVEKSRTQIMDAVDMRPETVSLVNGDDIKIIPAENAQPGDILLVRPGDRIPLDGIVADGESRIDTSPVTGEPVPVRVSAGMEVISGCVNEQGLLKIKVIKPLSESMVSRILDSVENAAAGKPKIDKFITKFAKVYTPIVVILAVLTAIIPSLITGSWSFWITTAITFLVISCPCALVISVPLAFFSGIGAASKLGILFKWGISIEALKKVKAVIMDKTGTITKGNFAVQSINSADDMPKNQLLQIAASCEANSTHPIAVSIIQAALQRNIKGQTPESLEEISGMGIKAELPQGTALCGNKALMDKYGIDTEKNIADGTTEIFVALDGKFKGSITISDTIKSDAEKAIQLIKSRGLVPVMLTGDAEGSARFVADKVGISQVYAHLMPEDKLNALKNIRNDIGPVMFVGDGINDAPVLAGADVGAAMGSGADAAIEAADVVFMNSSVEAIPQAMTIADNTGRIAIQNVVFALVIKILVILLGFVGFANIWAAVFADTGVAMLCILNSLRILWKKY